MLDVLKPRVLQERDIPELLVCLRDPARRGALFLAGSAPVDGMPFDPWAAKVGDWTRGIVGIGHAYALTPDATARLRDELGGQAVAWIGLHARVSD